MKKTNQTAKQNNVSVKLKLFCALIIVFSALGLEKYSNPQPLLHAYLPPFGIIFFVLEVLASILKIILAVNALLLKEWARKYLVLIMIPCVVFIFINKFFHNASYWDSLEKRAVQEYQQISLEQKQKFEQARAKFENNIKKYPPQEQEYLRQTYDKLNNELPVIVFRAFNLLASTITLFWHLLVIYFFTLPGIKSLFKKTPGHPNTMIKQSD